MLVPVVRFPISTGQIATHLRTELTSWSSLVIAPKRPATMPKRFLSIRDDGGTPRGGLVPNRYGVNVWADVDLDAQNIARDAMTALQRMAGVWRFKSTGSFFGPIQIDDDPAMTFGGVPMGHHYFTFTATFKGVDAS